MRRRALFFSALLFMACAASAQPLAFTSVTVIDVADGAARPGMTVVIRGDRITAVGKADAVEIPSGATVIDAKGKYLIPGLWDMHTHVFSNDAHPGTDLAAWAFPLYVANGVTGVRDMWTDPDDIVVARRWNDARARMERLIPRVEWSSEIIDGSPPHWPHATGANDPEEARRVVRELAAGGAGFIKVYWRLPREVFFAVVEEATREGIPFAGHVPSSVSAFEASDAGMKSIEHLTGVLETCSRHAAQFQQVIHEEWTPKHSELMWSSFDAGICAELYARFAQNHTWQVPTLIQTQSRFLAQEAGLVTNLALRYVPDSERRTWLGVNHRAAQRPLEVRRARFARILQIVGDMHRAGVGLLAGTDVGNKLIVPGISLHDELALMVEAGLTPTEALQTATLNPARYFGRADEFGSVEEAKVADLVLLEANPLEDIRNTQRIDAVVLNGRLLDRKALDAMLAEVERTVKE